ncbi:hypothetical protein OPT61_g9228 [Boeremia exigua]|uniref:Uncharacterized protein n=1 Tax=Boeremia exigua TaxID=749465 RepID=A0ACC2HW27_9PLEO|nr:hypothetical protein OPT61_g9228 [Boeremia exigua]
MDSKPSLFARARPRTRVSIPQRKKKLRFFDLPGEIRNRVYKYYFQDTYRCEFVGKGCDFSFVAPKTVKLLSNITSPRRSHEKRQSTSEPEKPLIVRFPHPDQPRLGCRTAHPRTWLNPHGALVVVCKQTYKETLPLLYQRTTFIFQAPRRITDFLHNVPTPNLTHLTKLHLHYTTYGNPRCTRDVIWQDKHLASWTRACKAASKCLTTLRALEIDVWLNDTTPKFSLRQAWLQPLWHFRRLACGSDSTRSKLPAHALRTVEVRVRTRLWAHGFEANTRLAAACRRLHVLYGLGIGKAILGAAEVEAMAEFEEAWNGEYRMWRHHLGFAKTGW